MVVRIQALSVTADFKSKERFSMGFLLKCSVTFLMNISVLLFKTFSGRVVTALEEGDVVLVLHTEVSASWRSKTNKGKLSKSALYFYEQFIRFNKCG